MTSFDELKRKAKTTEEIIETADTLSDATQSALIENVGIKEAVKVEMAFQKNQWLPLAAVEAWAEEIRKPTINLREIIQSRGATIQDVESYLDEIDDVLGLKEK